MADIKTIAVIGAGPLGREIAHAAALGGFRIALEDILPASLRRAHSEIRDSLHRGVELGELSPQQANNTLARIEFAGSIDEAARAAELVIEAVPDELESKLEIFILLDKICAPATILVSSTSSLSITEIASVTYRAGRCAGMRFINPLNKMKVLEIICGADTDHATVDACVDVGNRMGKEVVVVKDSSAFAQQR